MAKLTEIDEFTEEVYQIEVTDFVEGGENGVDNLPHKALTNRTKWLKSKIDAFLGGTVKVKNAILADTATKLETARKINGVAFNGSEDIAVSDTTIVGQVAFFAMETAPSGWLKANGALLNRTTYAVLFAKIGTIFGVGDGSTTFQLPDLRGEFIRGWGNNGSVDSDRAFGTYQQYAIENITGQSNFGDNQNNTGALVNNTHGAFYSADHNGVWYQDYNPDLNSLNNGRTLVFDASRVVKTALETRPRNIALLACIKY